MGSSNCVPEESTRLITLLGISKTPFEWFALVLGPVIYFAFLFAPLGGTITQQGGLGIIAWSAWWWGTGCLPTGYVMAVPILGTAFLPGMKFGPVLQTLIHPGIGMILGPALIVCMWSRWGFTRRMALFCLSKVGTSVRAQAVTWLLLSASISFFVANVVIAIAMTPIALEMLKAVGYDTASKLRKSKECMLIVIAIGIGASVGGFLTPMAGGQAVITWTQLSEALGFQVSMISFTVTMFVPVILSLIPVAILFGCIFPIDIKAFDGSTEFFKEQLRELGPLTKSEIWGIVIFLLAIALPFLMPVWRPYLPESLDINPSLIFTCVTVILAILPAPDQGAPVKPFPYQPNERLLSFNAIKILPVQAFLIWPTAMSISLLVNMTGTTTLLAQVIDGFWNLEPYTGTGLFTLFCGVLGNAASDTGAAGMIAPILAKATLESGVNPVPWLLMMGYTVNFAFMVPSATGTMALPIALEGKASWRLPVYGFFCSVACCLVSWAFWGTVLARNWTFFMTLS